MKSNAWSRQVAERNSQRAMRRDRFMAEEKKEMTVREAGKKGGTIVSQRYGKGFYEEIGKKGGSTTKKKYGADFYGQIGKKGGQTTSDRHGPEFYEKIGKKGGQRVKELIERAKASEES
jgi:general stress protein YciG